MSASVSNGTRTGSIPTQTGQLTLDPARRPDVLFRRRKPADYEVSAWWLIGSFVAVTVAVVGMITLFPGG